MTELDIACVSEQEDSSENDYELHRQSQASFPKRLGSFQTKGVFISSNVPAVIPAGTQLIFPLKARKQNQKKRRKMFNPDEQAMRFLVLENVEPLIGGIPPLQGHYDRFKF
jgi:hypothetical protein